MNHVYRLALCAAVSTTALSSSPLFAQASSASDEAEAPTIVVTGTRRTDRTVADSPVPIDVISGDQLTNTGLTETNKILNQLVPSFNFPQPSIADGSDVIRPASLRGLAPDQTLVLLNGKRRHVSALLNVNGTVGRGSAAVDLNMIPGLAIERIEVLRDGASSQYGSDAIAGVINVRMRQADSGGRITATFGKYVSTMQDVPELLGLQSNAGQPFFDPADTRYLAGNYGDDLKVRDGQYWTIAGNIGLPVGEGFVNLTGEYRDRDPTNRSGFDLRPNYNRPTTAFDARELTFNRRNFKFGDAKTEDWNLFLNSGMPIGDAWDFYLFGSYGQRKGLSAANYRQANSANNRDFSTITPSTAPNAANFTALRPDGFLPFIGSDLEDYSGTVGIKGELAGWKVDLSAGLGHNRFDYTISNSVNTSYGPQTQSTFDAGGLQFEQQLVNLDVSREIDAGLAGPLSVAFGAEYRNENFQIRPGDTQSYAAGPFFVPARVTTAANCTTLAGVFAAATGVCSFPGRQGLVGSQGFPGFPASSATDESRNSFSAYAEFDADVVENFTITAAARYEHYSDFGSTVTAKVAGRYEPVEGFALRGSYSNGFRAPSLHQQYFTTTSTNFIAGLPVDISTLPVNSPVARVLGAQDLDAEKSRNLSLGVALTPVPNLSFTVDFYKIDVKDRIVLTENLGASGTGSQSVRDAVKAVLDANGFQSVGAARFFINGLNTSTKGLDAILSYRLRTENAGNWTLTAAYNMNQTAITKRINALGPLASIPGLVLFGRVEGLRFTDGQPKNKLVLTAEGTVGKFGITARSTRYGTVISPDAAAPLADANSLTLLGPDDLTLSPKWITDLELRYSLMEQFDLAIGANNLLDVYPVRRPFGARPTGGVYPINATYLPYSGFSPFGFNGRFVYGRVSVKF